MSRGGREDGDHRGGRQERRGRRPGGGVWGSRREEGHGKVEEERGLHRDRGQKGIRRTEKSAERKKRQEGRRRRGEKEKKGDKGETISKWAVALLWVVLRYIRKLGGRGGLLS